MKHLLHETPFHATYDTSPIALAEESLLPEGPVP
jgi:hypothetical protein